jgi:signal transduction histidine kinase
MQGRAAAPQRNFSLKLDINLAFMPNFKLRFYSENKSKLYTNLTFSLLFEFMKTQTKKIKDRELLISVSHDIKSPLKGILGYAGLIAEESFNLEHRKMAGQIEKAGFEILQFVNNMLAMVKIEAGNEIPDFKWVNDLKEEVEEILKTFYLEARSKNVKLEIEIPEPVSRVYWDIEKLRLHVFNNIISNALRFTPTGGKIKISAKSIGETIRISIEDSGPGVSVENREKIFEPYGQAGGKPLYRHQEGQGLGLYNARLFVERHGGKIYLETIIHNDPPEASIDENATTPDEPGESRGAKFVIELPVFPEKIIHLKRMIRLS